MTKFKVSNNVTSYDIGEKPFKPDETRGKWASNWDFFAACIMHSLHSENFGFIPMYVMAHGVAYFAIPYTLGLLLFTIPIFFIQSFLGQFSSSGFISAFRIAPLFKGIGYVVLALNITATTYYGMTVALPFLFLMLSLSPQLPWMTCGNSWNTKDCKSNSTTNEPTKTESPDTYSNLSYLYDYEDDGNKVWASHEHLTRAINMAAYGTEWTFAWRIFLCTIVVWVLLGFALFLPIDKLGKIFRYSAIVVVSILILIFIRVLFLEEPSAEGLKFFFRIDFRSFFRFEFWVTAPYLTTLAFGSGWSTTLTLASYNKFKCDIGKISLMICFSHMLLLIMSVAIAAIIDSVLTIDFKYYYHMYNNHPTDFLYGGIPQLFGSIGGSNFWSFLFYLMLFLCELSSLIIQALAILTALFDEYENLREIKKQIRIGFVIIMGLTSIFFASNHGVTITAHLFSASRVSQMIICFLELMVVVWVYGRLRFQRDVNFMLGRTFSTWIFFIIRFATPIFIFFAGLIYVIIALEGAYYPYYRNYLVYLFIIVSTIIKLAPIIFIPGYVLVKMSSTSGRLINRFKRLCRPNDWYPADKNDRDRYESTVGSASEIAQQLIVEDYEVP